MYVAICVSLCVYVSLCAVVSRQMLCIAGVILGKLKDSDTAKQMQKRANVCLGARWLHWGYGKEVECGRDKVIYRRVLCMTTDRRVLCMTTDVCCV